jgi:prolyl 4-hydroxylase
MCADALNHVLVLRETSVFPNSEDLHGAAIALVRLQDTYQLNVTDLADGHYNGVDHSKGQGFLFHFLFFVVFFFFFFNNNCLS